MIARACHFAGQAVVVEDQKKCDNRDKNCEYSKTQDADQAGWNLERGYDVS